MLAWRVGSSVPLSEVTLGDGDSEGETTDELVEDDRFCEGLVHVTPFSSS